MALAEIWEETMSLAGMRPLTPEELSHENRAAIAALPADAGSAMRWLRRGHLVTSPLLPLAVRRTLLRLGGVRLGKMIWGLQRCYMESEHISIGEGAAVNAGCWFEGHGQIDIGSDSFIGPEVMIVTSVHAFGPGDEVDRRPTYRPVAIGNRCWIGARAMIMPGVTIGEGTVIAAGAIVTKDCEADALYAGVPARRLR
jgi:maltose O-acetyltransferase